MKQKIQSLLTSKLGTESFRKNSPCISRDLWDSALKESGFLGVDLEFRDFASQECHEISVLVSTAIDLNKYRKADMEWLYIIADVHDATQMALAESVLNQL